MKDLFPDNTFDKVVSFEGIEHLHNPNYFLDEVKRTLKPQGLFIISTPRKPHGSPFHIKEYDLDEFKELLQDKFKILEIYGQLFTDFHNLATSNINPNVYRRFNFIAICSNEK
jgi:2-polyprenyl-3-methyl-5-hydroxy-6-metoxy-1,4-benzoquinol methylase